MLASSWLSRIRILNRVGVLKLISLKLNEKLTSILSPADIVHCSESLSLKCLNFLCCDIQPVTDNQLALHKGSFESNYIYRDR